MLFRSEIKTKPMSGCRVAMSNITIGKSMEFTGLGREEIVKIYENHRIISSLGSGVYRLANSNLVFFEFVKGLNEVRIDGDFEYIKIVYRNMYKAGV